MSSDSEPETAPRLHQVTATGGDADQPQQHPAPTAATAEELDDEPAAEPTLSELLTATGRGETAAFSAFFEATSDVVYGLALLMHADTDGAQHATVAVYQHLWDQADARARDLRLQTQASQLLTDEHSPTSAVNADDDATYRPNEYELVLEWLVPLAHRIFVERFRAGIAAPIQLAAVPQSDGGGVAGLPEEVVEDLLGLSDAQAQALAMTYLAGMTHQQLADEVGAAVPSVKSRLRDALTRLHTVRTQRHADADPILRAAVTREDLERSSGVNRNFTKSIAADLDKGLLVELAELYALDGVDDAERALLDEKALTAASDEAQRWEVRVLAARRTLAEIFTHDPVVPPSGLLEVLLESIGDQEVGVGLVQEVSAHTEETERRAPVLKRWMYIAGFLVVLLLGAVVIWQVTAEQDVRAMAADDPDAVQIEGYQMAAGGEVDGAFSAQEDVGYLEFEDVPQLDGDATYQLWLLPMDDAPASSLGNFTAEQLESDGVEIRGIARYSSLQITVEEVRGLERPSGGELVANLPVQQ